MLHIIQQNNTRSCQQARRSQSGSNILHLLELVELLEAHIGIQNCTQAERPSATDGHIRKSLFRDRLVQIIETRGAEITSHGGGD